MSKPAISVILTTYNSEAWLEKVLIGYQHQQFEDFELVIADDGSGPATRELLARFAGQFRHPLQHIWHADDGFRKCEIQNKAIVAARADYLIISDGDCIPRRDFVQAHMTLRKPGHFVAGNCVRLPMATSLAIDAEDIASGRCFDADWLLANGFARGDMSQRITAKGRLAWLLDMLSPTKVEFYGNNAACWKADAIAVNGFEERMRYGGSDFELGDRLKHLGVQGIRARYRAIVFHLDHGRPYADPERIKANRAIWDEMLAAKRAWTDHGIRKPQAG